MSRLIDADALKRDLEISPYNDYDDYLRTERLIDYAPTIEERPKGKWIVGNVDGKRTWICSECGAVPSDWVNKSHYATTKVNRFCRYCGADMRGDEI